MLSGLCRILEPQHYKIMTKSKRKWIFAHEFIFGSDPKHYEPKPYGKSLVVPNDGFTIRELMERSQAGLINMPFREALYDDDPDYDDYSAMELQAMDMAERQQVAEHAKELIDKFEEQSKVKKEPPKEEPAEEKTEELEEESKE